MKIVQQGDNRNALVKVVNNNKRSKVVTGGKNTYEQQHHMMEEFYLPFDPHYHGKNSTALQTRMVGKGHLSHWFLNKAQDEPQQTPLPNLVPQRETTTMGGITKPKNMKRLRMSHPPKNDMQKEMKQHVKVPCANPSSHMDPNHIIQMRSPQPIPHTDPPFANSSPTTSMSNPSVQHSPQRSNSSDRLHLNHQHNSRHAPVVQDASHDLLEIPNRHRQLPHVPPHTAMSYQMDPRFEYYRGRHPAEFEHVHCTVHLTPESPPPPPSYEDAISSEPNTPPKYAYQNCLDERTNRHVHNSYYSL